MKKNKEPDNTEISNENTSGKKQKIVTTLLIAVILILTGLLFYTNITKNKNVFEDQKDMEGTESSQKKSTDQPVEKGIDSNNLAEELSDTNSISVDSTVPIVTEEKEPDLYIISYSFSEDPESGEEFKVNIKIGNKGNANAEGFHWEWWSTAYGKSCDGEVDGLASGKTETVECKYTYQSWATYETKAVVDSKKEVKESSERNNIATKQIIPIHDEKPDLYVSGYSFNHDPEQGEEFTVSITIKNKGSGDADSFWWEWWPTAYGNACREKINDLDPGESKTVKCDYTYGGWANYATKAVADADHEISESDESNNAYSKDVIPIH